MMVTAVLEQESASTQVFELADTFNILAASIKAAGLNKMLAEDGEYTVFAPTDEAFANLPEGTLARLLQDKEKLKAMLKYHMVPGKVSAKQIKEMPSARTLEGHPIHIWNCTNCSKMWINDAEVIDSDMQAYNGIVHVIDTVLLPS